MTDFKVNDYVFEPYVKTKRLNDCEPLPSLRNELLGTNWPVVYILYSAEDSSGSVIALQKNNKPQLYVGESTSATQRMKDHMKNPARSVFNHVKVIFDKKYSKSAILDIEQSLINLFFADKQYQLQNRNEGQSDAHDYYDRSYYQAKVREIWQELKDHSSLNIQNDYNTIVNSKLFKFSPHTSLTQEQNSLCTEVLNDVFSSIKSNTTPFVARINGKAGTGKTIVLMHMFGMLEESKSISSGKLSNGRTTSDSITEYNNLIGDINDYKSTNGLKFAYVCSCDSLYDTMKEVVKGTFGRRSVKKVGRVMKPSEIASSTDTFDVVFIDEAHRLFQKPVGRGIDAFRNTNDKLFGGQCDSAGSPYTQIDWILKKAKTVVMVYDENQTVRTADITSAQFENAFKRNAATLRDYKLQGQMRCNGGIVFMEFLEKMLSLTDGTTIPTMPDVGSYDFKLFEDAPSLINAIANNDKEYGLCRTMAGPGWQYVARRYIEEIRNYEKATCLTDREIYSDSIEREKLNNHLLSVLNLKDGVLEYEDSKGVRHKYIRNLENWVLKGNPYEIGCIHMVQGYDLNFAGVIFTKEIHYDKENHKVYIDKKSIADKKSISNNLTDTDVATFVINTYKVLMSRGVQGCYLYAENTDMQDYLKSIFKQ